jgi:hypothetical protein
MQKKSNKNCLRCSINLETGNKSRGYCKNCYRICLRQGLITPKKKEPKIEFCQSCKDLTKLIGKFCPSCYSRFANARLVGIKFGKCKTCQCQLPKDVWTPECQVCNDKFEDIEISEGDLIKVKLLTIKWLNNIIRPDEILESVSLFCELKPKMDIDTYNSKKQIQLIFREFKRILDSKLNIYKK